MTGYCWLLGEGVVASRATSVRELQSRTYIRTPPRQTFERNHRKLTNTGNDLFYLFRDKASLKSYSRPSIVQPCQVAPRVSHQTVWILPV